MTNKWTKPVTSKLRKKSLRVSTSSQVFAAEDLARLAADEPLDNHDSWSLVSPPASNRASPTHDFEHVRAEEAEPAAQDEVISLYEEDETSPRATSTSRYSTWSFVYAEPDQEQLETNSSGVPRLPSIVIDPPPPEGHGNSCNPFRKGQTVVQNRNPFASNNNPFAQDRNPFAQGHNPFAQNSNPFAQDQNGDFRGARSFWEKPIDISELFEQVKQLQADHSTLVGSTRELFEKQETQISDLQNTRSEIEASREDLEKRVQEQKEEYAWELETNRRLRTTKNPYILRQGKPKEYVYDSDEGLGLPCNLREQAILRTRGREVQRTRSIKSLSSHRPVLSHAESNPRQDFPYKTGTFIHRDVQPIYNAAGVRIGWNHKHMPSYKRIRIAAQLNTSEQLLGEIGKLPIPERMEALRRCEVFTQAVGRGRRQQTKGYTQRKITESLRPVGDGVDRDTRHDSLAEDL